MSSAIASTSEPAVGALEAAKAIRELRDTFDHAMLRLEMQLQTINSTLQSSLSTEQPMPALEPLKEDIQAMQDILRFEMRAMDISLKQGLKHAFEFMSNAGLSGGVDAHDE
ncbi:unnamed protein product [Peniophora sp. CBMAI 1063]|nr:unnamed protein product [Peniophora sp. CBMAI 1063]